MVDSTERAEVVVVGCGPGGATLAYLLARSGVDVALLERAATFEREYRGFGWNPGVIRLFDEMDVLEDVRSLAHETLTTGRLSLYGDPVTVVDFGSLDTDYPYVLMMEQPALLARLVERARAYDGFSFHPATTVTDLETDASGSVCGVRARDRRTDREVTLGARAVVGADGRYSTVRSAADIDPGLFESPIDLLWFKLPRGAVEVETQGQLARDGVLVSFGLGGGELQVGYLLRDGEWPSVRAAGFEAFRERVAAVDPAVAAAVGAHLDGFRDTTLLDVAPGIAPEWTRDGLALLGDAAHVASPIGAQGNPLAVEDAVVLHDCLRRALGEGDGVVSAAPLREFERRRRPTVERVIDIQRRAAANFALWLDYGPYLPPRVVAASARALGWLVSRSGRVRGLVESFALGDRSVSVAREHFVD